MKIKFRKISVKIELAVFKKVFLKQKDKFKNE